MREAWVSGSSVTALAEVGGSGFWIYKKITLS